MMEFLSGHSGTIGWAAVSIVLYFLPNDKLYEWGLLVRKKFPKDIVNGVGNKFSYFVKGLLDKDVDGQSNLISNDQLEDEAEKFKIDLGLDKKKV